MLNVGALQKLGFVLKVLVKKGSLRIHFLKADPNQIVVYTLPFWGGDRYSEQLPFVFRGGRGGRGTGT